MHRLIKFHVISKQKLLEKEREDFTSSANQLGCTDMPGLSVTWSNIHSKAEPLACKTMLSLDTADGS